MKLTEKVLASGVSEVVLENSAKTAVTLWSWGATLAKWVTVDCRGELGNIVLSLPLETCLREQHYLGATVGPVAGRIANASIELDKIILKLTANEGKHHLHGGANSFDQQNWQLNSQGQTDTMAFVEFRYEQPALTNGYPGNMVVFVKYTLTEENQLEIKYRAKSDQKTLFNPTNHSYFNLSAGESTVDTHVLQVASDYYVPLGPDNLPLGIKKAVGNSPFSLQKESNLGDVLAARDAQIIMNGGLNHGFDLNSQTAISLTHPETGRRLRLITTESAVVIYTGNHFDGRLTTIEGRSIEKHGGIALETQQLPDCDNQVGFGSVVLQAGKVYESQTIFSFDLIDDSN